MGLKHKCFIIASASDNKRLENVLYHIYFILSNKNNIVKPLLSLSINLLLKINTK